MKNIDESNLTENNKKTLCKIRSAVLSVLPDASVILFGSRARDEARDYSDWDILVLADEVDWKIERLVNTALYEVELDENIIIGSLVLPRYEWETSRFKNHPLHERVDAEGVLV